MRRTLLAAACALFLLCPAQARNASFLQRRVSDWLHDLNRADKPAKRGAAAFALGRMGKDAEAAIPDLAKKAATDKDASVRDASAAALGQIILDLKSDDQRASYFPSVRVNLLAALADADEARVRRSAAYALGAFGKAAESASQKLLDCLLQDKSTGVRQNAAWAVGRIGVKDRATFTALSAALQDGNASVRRDAAGSLHLLGKDVDPSTASTTANRLLALIRKETDDSARKTALNALSVRVGPEHAGSARDIIPFAESKDEDTARIAAQVLGQMGAAEEIAKVLSRSKDNKVRRICCVALSHLHGEKGKPGIPALVEALKPTGKSDQASEEVRYFAAQAIAQIGYPSNEAAIPAVRQAIMEDKNHDLRHRCVWALFNIQELDKYDLIKPLTKVLDESGDKVRLLRYDAARVLAFGEGDRAPDKVVDVLVEMLTDPKLLVFQGSDSEVEGGSEKKGGTTGVKNRTGGDARYMAAVALGWMKDKTKNHEKAVAALKAATKDKDPTLREKAQKTVQDLGIQ